MSDPFIKIFALEQNDKNVGIIVLKISDPKQIEILDIAVKPDRQQRGVGRKLIDFCSREFKAESIIAETDDEAVGFYEKLGFKVHLLGDKYNVGINRYLCKLMIK